MVKYCKNQVELQVVRVGRKQKGISGGIHSKSMLHEGFVHYSRRKLQLRRQRYAGRLGDRPMSNEREVKTETEREAKREADGKKHRLCSLRMVV